MMCHWQCDDFDGLPDAPVRRTLGDKCDLGNIDSH